MKILLDENTDQSLAEFLLGHTALHVLDMGWQGTTNGQLLARAQEEGFEVFITADKNMPYQQRMQGRPFCLIVLDIHPNVLASQAACVPMIEEHLQSWEPGKTCVIEGPHPKRRNQ